MKENLNYQSPACEILQTEALSNFLEEPSGPIVPWDGDNEEYDF